MKIYSKTSARLARCAILLLLTTSIAHAQLALIRQGRESVGVIEEGDYYGDAVALGDFNGDGWDDLATGAPLEKTGSPTFSSGHVTINWGTPHGLTWVNAMGLSVIDGGYDPAKNSQMGRAFAVGDFNADGYDDLAVGLPAAEVSGESAAGAVFVYYGSSSGLPGAASLIHQGMLGAAVESGDVFGSALAAGKIGNDQYDDLVIGSPGENTTAGAVFIVRGGALGLNTAQRQIILASDLGSTSNAGERFGDAVAVGDVVGLANEDLIIGAPFAEITPSASGSGRAFVVIGNNNGVALNNVLELTPLTVGDSLFLQGNFGSAFAIGGLWGDGAPNDLVIGAPGAHAGGRAYVGRGSPFGMAWPIAPAQDGSDSNNDNFGSAMAIGDHDDDGFDDLAVGNPGEDSIFGLNIGAVHIFSGSNTGLSQGNVTSHYEFNLGDTFSGEGRLGSSLAAGRTSASARHSFVAGAPYKNDGRGQVYDIAPWRQVRNLACRSALAADCENNIVYALKPFDRLKIASTTKIMTVLLGCEATTRSLADPLHVALNETYTIESWMYAGFPLTSGCSIFGFTPLPTQIITENYTFNELLRICFPPSGNDVCYAIADKMTGEITNWSGHATSAPMFVQLMNDRAAQIGMNDTLFTNPAGVDSANPYSTAYDMWLLSLEAMENPLFRDIADSTDFIVDKLMPSGAQVGQFQSVNVNSSYTWLKNMKSRDSRIVGLKPGGTPGAKTTGVVAAEISPITKRLAHANGFGWDDGVYSRDRLAELVQLGMSFCNTDFGNSPDGITGLPGPITHQKWNANDESRQAIQFSSFDSTPETNTPASGDGHSDWIELISYAPDPTNNNSRFRIGWQYRALWELAPGAQAGVTVGPANGATGYFRNITAEEAERSGDATLMVISTSTGSAPQTVLLDSGDQHEPPDWIAPTTSGAEWTINVQNIGTETVFIAFVGEYQFLPTFTGIAGEFFRAHLHPLGKSVRDGHTVYEDEPIEGAPIFPVEIVVENRVDGMRFLPPMKIKTFSIEPASPTHNDWSIQFESVLDPSPPLNAFYSAFDIETSRDLGSWSKVDGLEVTPAIAYDWTGELPRGGTLFLRTRGQPAD